MQLLRALLIATILVAGTLPGEATAPTPSPAAALKEAVIAAVGRADAERSDLESLRTRLATEIPRSELADGDWIDLHLQLQALSRKLAARPGREGKRGEPIGRELYEWKLRHEHVLDLSAGDLELIGEMAWSGTIALLESEAARLAPGTTWQELSRRARLDAPQDPDGLLPMVRELTLEAWRYAEDCGFVSVPEVARALGLGVAGAKEDKPFAWYVPGKPRDVFYEGTFMLAPVPADLEPAQRAELLGDVNRHWMQVVALHEGIPGHHLQFAIASQVDSPVRGWGYTSVYVEGWGLYCEEAMARHGFYSSLTRIEQLRMRLWRSARVLLDVRLHCGRIEKEDAVALLVDGVLMAPDNARREVDRYLHMPTQPMSYVVGMTQIESIRRRAEEKAGDAFDERAFHDRLLSFGPIPFDLLAPVLLDEREAYDRRVDAELGLTRASALPH